MNKKFACVLTRTVMALSVAAAISGCDDDDNEDKNADQPSETPPVVEEKRIAFRGIEAPATAQEKAATTTSTEVEMDGTAYAIGHTVFATTNEEMPLLQNNNAVKSRADGDDTVKFGTWLNNQGEAFTSTDGSEMVCTNGSGPDFTSLLSYEENGTTTLFATTNMECSVGGVWITKLEQDPGTGELSAVATRPADFSDEFGTYVNCAGQVTPWGTHLGSEEYEPPMPNFDPTAVAYEDQTEWGWASQDNIAWFDSDDWHDEHILGITQYNGMENNAANAAKAGYYFGWAPEVAITSAYGDHTVTKHYAMGRFAHELSYVMPDSRTVYQSDDGANTGLFMFVADKARDLSSGYLYAAKWNQTSGEGLGSANIDWVNLGHATNAQIRAALDAGITYGDMFDQEDPAEDNTCPTEGFMPVNAYDHGLICVMPKSGQFAGVDIPTLASRLETRLYAGLMGATTEFRKEEGITYDPETERLFVAMSEVARGMENNSSIEKGDDRYDRGGPNHIRVATANLCGGVYAMDRTSETVQSTDGMDIPSNLVVTNMYGLVAGTHEGDILDEVCDVDGIANPDNIAMIDGKGVLLIGEDTGAGNHENNFVWAYDLEDDTLTRIAATPEGAETTSPFWHGPFNGWYYITLVNQHPDGAESEVGYIGPFPAN